MTPEGAFQKDVKALLQASGIWFMRMNSGIIRKGSRYIHLHETGTADWLLFPLGGVAWLESKASGQKTSKERTAAQEAFRVRCLEAGHKHLRTDNLTELAEWLRSLK